MAQAATKKKTQVKDRFKSGEYRLLRIKNPPAFIGLAHNVALKANDEADCVQYVPFRKCSKCWMIYAKATSSNVITAWLYLKRLTAWLYSIKGSSCPSEGMFSEYGNIVSAKTARLGEKKAEDTLFLHQQRKKKHEKR
eukprot:911086_1